MRGVNIERIERLITMKKYNDVLKILFILLKNYPKNKVLREKIASIYLFLGEKEKAKKYLDKDNDLIKIKTLNDFRIIDELVARRKYKEAITEAYKFLLKYPENNFVRIRLAELYIALGKDDKAKKIVGNNKYNIMKIKDDKMTNLQKDVEFYVKKGDYFKGYNLFKKILRKYEVRGSKNKLVELSILAGTKEGIFEFISEKEYNYIKNRNRKLDKFNYYK